LERREGIPPRTAGKRLLAEALAFCDHVGFPEVELRTFAGLDAAFHA
jgi:hypothetical protein